jgi:hypothetical protein
MKQHLLKTDSEEFDDIAKGLKTFEMRLNDRDYQVDDQLILLKTLFTAAAMKNGSPLYYTGDALRLRVTHILSGPAYGLMEGWVVMSIIRIVI